MLNSHICQVSGLRATMAADTSQQKIERIEYRLGTLQERPVLNKKWLESRLAHIEVLESSDTCFEKNSLRTETCLGGNLLSKVCRMSNTMFLCPKSFFGIFRDLQDSRTVAPLQIQKFSKIS